jgi:MYXO-CTERM domain-containing protein
VLLTSDLENAQHQLKFRSLGVSGRTHLQGVPAETYIDAFDVWSAPAPEPSGGVLAALAAAAFTVRRRAPWHSPVRTSPAHVL